LKRKKKEEDVLEGEDFILPKGTTKREKGDPRGGERGRTQKRGKTKSEWLIGGGTERYNKATP